MATTHRFVEKDAAAAYWDAIPQLSWQSQVAALWAAAGGTAAGGLVAVLLLLGRIHPDGSLAIAMLLASAGAVLGLIHGVVLGYVGRHVAVEQPLRPRDHVFGVLAAGGAIAAAVLLAQWLVLSAVLLRAGSPWGWLALGVGATAAAVIGVWATILGWRSLERAYLDWADHRLGAGLLAGSFAVLWIVFLVLRPAIPGTRLQLPAAGWLIVSVLATIWVATPAVVLALRAGRRTRRGS
jgi:hypothetical protein